LIMPDYDVIYDTPPLPIGEGLEVHMLVGDQFLCRTLWSLKTFWYFVRHNFYVVFHDDGTLSSEDKSLLSVHFPNSKIIDYDLSNSIVGAELRDYPLCYEYRLKNIYGKRLFDPFIFSARPYILMIDSDVLWYKENLKVKDWIRFQIPFYLDAGGPGFSKAEWWLKENDLQPARNFNECIVGIPRHAGLDYEEIEYIFKTVLSADEMIEENGKLIPNTGVGSYGGRETTYAHLGQTALAVLLERTKLYKVLPFKGHLAKYHWSLIWETLKIEDASVYHHVWDSKFNTFFKVGVKHLLSTGFIEKYQQRIKDACSN